MAESDVVALFNKVAHALNILLGVSAGKALVSTVKQDKVLLELFAAGEEETLH